jgi:hypothetical protein
VKLRTTAILAAATAMTLAACGSGGGSSTSTSTASPTAAAEPRPAFKCLQAAGLKVTVTPPSSNRIVSAMSVDSGQRDGVLIWFMKTPSDAQNYVKGLGAYLKKVLGSSATAEVVGRTIVVGSGATATDSQVSSVQNCLTT